MTPNCYVAPAPRCPTHGQMSYAFAADSWVCHGFDGEGCQHTVRCEDMDWQPIGYADIPPGTFDLSQGGVYRRA